LLFFVMAYNLQVIQARNVAAFEFNLPLVVIR
jgi:hypothetical protein